MYEFLNDKICAEIPYNISSRVNRAYYIQIITNTAASAAPTTMYRMLKCNRFFIFFFFNRSTYKIVKWLNCMRAHQSFHAVAAAASTAVVEYSQFRLTVCISRGRLHIFTYGVICTWFMVQMWTVSIYQRVIIIKSSTCHVHIEHRHLRIWIDACLAICALPH